MATAAADSPMPRRAKCDAPMAVSPQAAQSRVHRNELSPIDGSTLPPASEGPPAKVRVNVPEGTTAPTDITVRFLHSEIEKLRDDMRQAITHVAQHVDANAGRVAGLTAEMAVVKLHCKESPTIAEHQDVQSAIPNLSASIAQVIGKAEQEAVKLGGLTEHVEKIRAETVEALRMLDAALVGQKELEASFQRNVMEDGTGLQALHKLLDSRVKLIERTRAAGVEPMPAAAATAACGPANALETLENKIVEMQVRMADLDGVYGDQSAKLELAVIGIKDELATHDGYLSTIQATTG